MLLLKLTSLFWIIGLVIYLCSHIYVKFKIDDYDPKDKSSRAKGKLPLMLYAGSKSFIQDTFKQTLIAWVIFFICTYGFGILGPTRSIILWIYWIMAIGLEMILGSKK